MYIYLYVSVCLFVLWVNPLSPLRNCSYGISSFFCNLILTQAPPLIMNLILFFIFKNQFSGHRGIS